MPLQLRPQTENGNGVDPDARFIAWQSFCWGPHAMVVQQDTLLRGTDPAVLACPDMFVPSDLPRGEWPTVFDHVVAINDAASAAQEAARKQKFEDAAKRNRVKLDATQPRVYRLTRDVTATVDGQPATLQKGSLLLEGDPLIVEHGDAFEAVR